MSSSEPLLVQEEILVPDLPAPLAGAIAAGPYNFEFTGEDLLRLTVHNSLAGVAVTVAYRFKRRSDGRIVSNELTLVPTSDRVAKSVDFALGDGYLLNASAFASSGTPRRGQTFCRLRVMRGSGAPRALGTLLQGYVTSNQDRAWPGSPLEGSVEGDGYIRTFDGTHPPAAAIVHETCPPGARWELLYINTLLGTGGGAHERRARLWVRDAGAVARFATQSFGTITGSTSAYFIFAQGAWLASVPATFDAIVSGLPPLFLLAGDYLEMDHQLDAGTDNWQTPRVTVREWLEAQ